MTDDAGAARYTRIGNLCGDKIRYKDGIGYCIWYPFQDDMGDESSGICFDLNENDIDALIELLTVLKSAPALDAIE